MLLDVLDLWSVSFRQHVVPAGYDITAEIESAKAEAAPAKAEVTPCQLSAPAILLASLLLPLAPAACLTCPSAERARGGVAAAGEAHRKESRQSPKAGARHSPKAEARQSPKTEVPCAPASRTTCAARS